MDSFLTFEGRQPCKRPWSNVSDMAIEYMEYMRYHQMARVGEYELLYGEDSRDCRQDRDWRRGALLNTPEWASLQSF